MWDRNQRLAAAQRSVAKNPEKYRIYPHDNLLVVSKEGSIFSFSQNTVRVLKTTPKGKAGLLYMNLRGHSVGLHRMVAETWVHNPNPEQYYEIIHVDGDRKNNHADNLVWADRETMINHGYHSGIYKKTQTASVKVTDVVSGIEYASINAAARALGINTWHVHNQFKREQKPTDRYFFVRTDGDNHV